MAINDETYLDRLLTSEQAAGLPHILNLDPDVNVRREDYRSLSDAYNYYLGGGRDAVAPVPPSEVGVEYPDDYTGARLYDQGTGEGGTGITAAGPRTGITAVMSKPTVEQTAAMEDIGAIPSIIQDPMTGDASIAEAIAAQNRQDALTARMPTDYEAEAYGAPDTIASLQNVTPEAQGAWQKVQSGLASAGDFIRNYGMATYNFLAGNIGAGVMGLATGPLGLGLTAAASAFQTTPEQKAMQSAAQAAGIADPNDPRKDIYGTNIVSAFGDYDQSVADSIATLEESGANPEKLAALKNYQNEKAWEDVDTDMARDEDITARDAAIDLGIAAADEDAGMLDYADTGIDSRIADYRDPIMDMVPEQKTALDLAKDDISMDEFGNFYDAAGNIIEDPKKTETDIALASGETLGEKVYNKKSQELKNLEIQKQTIQEMPLSDEEKQKMIDQLDPAIKDLKDFLKKEKEKLDKEKVKVQKSSLVDLTDTGRDDTPITPDEEFAETGDYDVFSDTVDTGPTVDIADIGAEDEEDYSAPSAPTGISGPPGGGGADRDSAPTTTTFTPRGGGADRDPAPSRPAPAPSYGPHGGGGGGNGGSGGGGKIVCTMMNDSYGFGSFRNKIWLRQSKNLAPEYQIGYHKIFLPLVKLSKKNIVLKKILEHIAVHRTIDIRQESRGKTHMLGRIYRKILEPICYWVGKYGKRT